MKHTNKTQNRRRTKSNCELSPMENEDSMQAKRRYQVGQQLDQHRDCCVPGMVPLFMRLASELLIYLFFFFLQFLQK